MQQRKPNERPTLPPGFDVARYAKDSDARLARPVDDQATTKRSEIRIMTRPESLDATTDEGWASTVTGAPYCTMTPSALQNLPLDNRAGFLLSRMDGVVDLDMLVEISGMPRDEVLRIVRDLVESGVVDFRA